MSRLWLYWASYGSMMTSLYKEKIQILKFLLERKTRLLVCKEQAGLSWVILTKGLHWHHQEFDRCLKTKSSLLESWCKFYNIDIRCCMFCVMTNAAAVGETLHNEHSISGQFYHISIFLNKSIETRVYHAYIQLNK